MRFVNSKTRRISRLVRVLGINYLEDIFVSQATLSMLQPLRYKQLFLTRLKKIGGKYRRPPNNGNIKYDIRVPRNA